MMHIGRMYMQLCNTNIIYYKNLSFNSGRVAATYQLFN